MQKNIILKVALAAILLLLPLFLTRCKITDFVMSLITTSAYPCTWPNWANAVFVNPLLKLPNSTCDEPFSNHELEVSFPANSFYELMINNRMVTEPAYTLTWTVSVYEKPCDDSFGSEESKQLIFTQNDFWGRLLRSTYDWIELSPMIAASGDIGVNDLKHQLVFQLTDVINDEDGSSGTITWTRTWQGQNNASYTSNPTSVWNFYFPSEPLIGSFTPKNGFPRKIYINNHYVYQ